MEILKITKAKIEQDGDVVTVKVDDRYRSCEGRLLAAKCEILEHFKARKCRFTFGKFGSKDQEAEKLDIFALPVKIFTSNTAIGWTCNGYMALDFETDSEDALTANIIGMGLTNIDTLETCYFPISHNGYEDNIESSYVLSLLETMVEDRVTFIVHNLAFEEKLLHRLGVRNFKIRDTMIYKYLEDSSQMLGLKKIVKNLYKVKMQTFNEVTTALVPAKVKGKFKKAKIAFADVPVTSAASYCGADTYWTARIFQDTQSRHETSTELANLDHRVALICSEMERRGVYVDLPRLTAFGILLDQKMNLAMKKMYELAGYEFNPGSWQQMQQLLFEKLGFVATKQCNDWKTGKLSTGDDTLNYLLTTRKVRGQGHRHAVVALLQYWRGLAKLKGTYVEGILSRVDTDGKLHTQFRYTGTETGRLSSADPNLQNLPASGSGKEIRNCIIPPEGFSFVAADYSQIELRVLAHYMQDAEFIQTFIDGKDAHSLTAARVFKIPLESVKKDSEERRQAKTLNFAVIYQQGPSSTSDQLKITIDEAKELITSYYTSMPVLRALVDSIIEGTKRVGYAETLFGRRRYLPDINLPKHQYKKVGGAKRAAFNVPIQGTAAEIVRCAMIRVDGDLLPKYGNNAYMVMSVHDELVFVVRDDLVEAFSADLKGIMEDPLLIDGKYVLDFTVPLEVEIGVAKNYGESK